MGGGGGAALGGLGGALRAEIGREEEGRWCLVSRNSRGEKSKPESALCVLCAHCMCVYVYLCPLVAALIELRWLPGTGRRWSSSPNNDERSSCTTTTYFNQVPDKPDGQ